MRMTLSPIFWGPTPGAVPKPAGEPPGEFDATQFKQIFLEMFLRQVGLGKLFIGSSASTIASDYFGDVLEQELARRLARENPSLF